MVGLEWSRAFEEIDEKWSAGLVGLTKIEARDGGRKAKHKRESGKQPLSFGDYSTYAGFTIGRVTGPSGNACGGSVCCQNNTVRLLYAHSVLTLQWNLMCRASNAQMLHFGNLSWVDDALCVKFDVRTAQLTHRRADR